MRVQEKSSEESSEWPARKQIRVGGLILLSFIGLVAYMHIFPAG